MLKRKVIKKAARTTAAEKPPQGRRFDAAQKQHALVGDIAKRRGSRDLKKVAYPPA